MCLTKCRRIFLKASISPGFQGQQTGISHHQETFGGGGGGGGTKETCRGEFLQQCRFLVVFGGKQEVGDQSSLTEYE